MRFRISIVVLALVIAVSYEHVMSQSNSSYNGFDLVDKTGNIRKPSDYRDRYQALGTYMVLDPMGDPDARGVCIARHGRVLPQE